MHAMVADSARGQGRGWKPHFGHWTVPPTPIMHSGSGSLHAAGSAATSDPTDVDPLGLLACLSACLFVNLFVNLFVYLLVNLFVCFIRCLIFFI